MKIRYRQRLWFWCLVVAGGLLLLVDMSPASAASNNKKSASLPPAAERCRQLAAAWWGDRPGIGFDKIDPTVAVPICEQAVKKNPKIADLKAYLCRALLKAEHLKDALAQCRPAVDGGSLAGMTSIGEIFEHNFLENSFMDDEDFSKVFDLLESFKLDDEENAKQAMAWYRKAAERGYPPAQNNLGQMYANGSGVEQDETQAVAWYRKAAERGYPPAQNNLGQMYANGSGVEQDETQAVAWYRKAAERGYPPAQNNLGQMYANGSGVEQDETQAVAWYCKVIKRKDADAEVRIAAAEALGQFKNLRAVEPLLVALGDTNAEVRTAAAKALGELSDSQAVEPLIATLQDADAEVRTAVAWALANHAIRVPRDSRVMGPLIAALQDVDVFVRIAAAHGLGNFEDPRAVEPLIAALRDTDKGVREAAAMALSELNDSRAVEPLIAALRDTDKGVRKAVVRALAYSKDLRAIDVFIDTLQDTDVDVDVRQAAAKALGDLQDLRAVEPLIAALRDTDKGVREATARALIGLEDPRSIEPLTAARWDVDEGVRQAAGGVIKFKDPQAVEPLITALRDTDKGVRQAAAQALGKLKDPQGVEPLIAALRDTEEYVRSAAAEALGKLKDPRGVEPLIATLRDVDNYVRLVTAHALGHLQDLRAVEPLIAALRDTDEGVRGGAASALGYLKDSRARDPLIAALRDADESVRSTAAQALVDLKDPQAMKSLLAMLGDTDAGVRETAARALGSSKDVRAVKLLIVALQDVETRVRSAAAWALGSLKDSQAVKPLIAAMRDPDAHVRKLAAQALGDIKDPQAVESLVTMLGDIDVDVRGAAAGSLGYLGDSRAVKPLLALLGDVNPDLRNAAVWAFRDLKDPRAVKPLLGMLGDTNRYARESAVWTLITYFPIYTHEVLDLIHFSTKGITYYPFKLEILGEMWKFSNKLAVDEAVLEADLAGLRAAASVEAVDTNPYLALFAARLHQEQNHNDAALTWIERARSQLPVHETAPQIVLGWIEAEALRQANRSEAALVVINRLERELLPRLAGIERQKSRLAFGGQTLALKSILLDDLGQRQKAVEALHAAKKMLDWEKKQDWITETMLERVQYIIHGFQAKMQPDRTDKAEAVLAATLTPNSRLEKQAQRYALIAKLQQAIGSGDYGQAQQFGERLALTQQPVPSDLKFADLARQATYEHLQNLQQRIRQLDSEQDTAERALFKARNKEQSDRASNIKTQKELIKVEEELQTAKARRQQGWNELQEAVAQLKREHPQLAALLHAEPVDPNRWQSRLQDHQRLVRYLLLEDEGWVFVMSARAVEVVKLSVGWKALREPIRDYRLLLQTSTQNRGFNLSRGFTLDPPVGPVRNAVALSQQLSQQLLEPLRSHLHHVTHLLLIPNGPLHDLPFSALPWDGHFLVEQFQLSTLSSTSMLVTLNNQAPAAKPQLVALGNPTVPGSVPLPAAEQEVNIIATFFPPPIYPQPAIYLREKAQRGRLIGQDLNGKVLHLAVHGQARTLDDTQLILSDGPLKVGEIWGLALKQSPLVVLSACQTALGEHLGGDEVVSLANGFMIAGAQAVVSSLWPVPDQPTQVLIEAFYRQRDYGLAAALAAAQRAQIQAGRDPYDWAGFVIDGW